VGVGGVRPGVEGFSGGMPFGLFETWINETIWPFFGLF